MNAGFNPGSGMTQTQVVQFNALMFAGSKAWEAEVQMVPEAWGGENSTRLLGADGLVLSADVVLKL